MKKIGFIGCGNMGGALLRAVLCTISAEAVLVADADEKKTEAFKECGVTVSTASAIAEDADYIVLGVKPQTLPGLLSALAPAFDKREEKPVLISMAAGIAIEKIEKDAPACPIIRIMPNTPASVGEGMILWTAKGASEEQTELTPIRLHRRIRKCFR